MFILYECIYLTKNLGNTNLLVLTKGKFKKNRLNMMNTIPTYF